MQLTKEKLTYLLFLYKQREMDYTVTRLAQEVGVSKSTFSRVLNTFYQEGLTTEKGKGILSCQGCRMAREYLKDINKLSDWLKYTANFDDEEAYQEALSLVLTLSSKARAKLVNNTSKERLFELIDNVKVLILMMVNTCLLLLFIKLIRWKYQWLMMVSFIQEYWI